MNCDNKQIKLNGGMVKSGSHYTCNVEFTDRNRVPPPIYVEKSGRQRKGVWKHCSCGKKFVSRIYTGGGTAKHCSHKCSRDERYRGDRELKSCAFCGTEFTLAKSKLVNSKSGLHFCCRKHKDLAQRIENDILVIDHYKTGIRSYRKKALDHYGEKCEQCGYLESVKLLDVHHIDSDRSNNDIENLAVLCVTCHAKVTRGICTFNR